MITDRQQRALGTLPPLKMAKLRNGVKQRLYSAVYI
jgi:hypothetical protein